jgi:tetratricopeptide (TPR) repeat protein
MALLRLLLPLLLLLGAPSDVQGAEKKRRRRRKAQRASVPAVPAEYDEDGSCPFHRDAADAAADELSAFGHELERDGRQPEALRCYAQAVRSSPRAAIGWFDLAVARQHAEPAAALRMYAHGVSLEPSAFHYNQLGVMLRQAERQDEAARRFVQAARMAPHDADPLFNLGGTHELAARHGEALHAYRGALERERKNEARIQNNIGNVLARLSRWAEALAAYREAEEADPAFVETHQNLAHLLGLAERFDEADRHLARAARLQPAEAAEYEAERAALRTKRDERARSRRQSERRDAVNRRDGHLSREQRVERFQQVVGACGMDKECMKQVCGGARTQRSMAATAPSRAPLCPRTTPVPPPDAGAGAG